MAQKAEQSLVKVLNALRFFIYEKYCFIMKEVLLDLLKVKQLEILPIKDYSWKGYYDVFSEEVIESISS